MSAHPSVESSDQLCVLLIAVLPLLTHRLALPQHFALSVHNIHNNSSNAFVVPEIALQQYDRHITLYVHLQC